MLEWRPCTKQNIPRLMFIQALHACFARLQITLKKFDSVQDRALPECHAGLLFDYTVLCMNSN